MLIDRGCFLLYSADTRQTQTHKVEDDTDYPTHASAPAGVDGKPVKDGLAVY